MKNVSFCAPTKEFTYPPPPPPPKSFSYFSQVRNLRKSKSSGTAVNIDLLDASHPLVVSYSLHTNFYCPQTLYKSLTKTRYRGGRGAARPFRSITENKTLILSRPGGWFKLIWSNFLLICLLEISDIIYTISAIIKPNEKIIC